jgi:hypothetical protein
MIQVRSTILLDSFPPRRYADYTLFAYLYDQQLQLKHNSERWSGSGGASVIHQQFSFPQSEVFAGSMVTCQLWILLMSNYALTSPQADLLTILAKGSLGNHYIIQMGGWQTWYVWTPKAILPWTCPDSRWIILCSPETNFVLSWNYLVFYSWSIALSLRLA